MLIELSVRRLYRENTACEKVTFAEQIPGLTVRYQRRTPLLQQVVEAAGVLLSGRGGARMLRVLNVTLSRCTVLSQLMRMPLRSHFSINSFYCNPGIEGAHEKGGVEGQIGWFRRNHLVPVPKVASLAELNAMVERWDEEDDARRIMQRALTIGEMFAVEGPLLVPLPEEEFETGLVSSLRVNRYSQISVRTNHYSVPVRLIGRMVRVVLHASELVVYDAHKEVARHERLIAKGGSRLLLDHYLEALVRKPGALPGATALDQARSAGKFTPVHDAWWQAACKAHGDAEGTWASSPSTWTATASQPPSARSATHTTTP
ncbi:Mu transposase domain-containing protein [Streptomyces europaeiscabiei]|uniref:Mu transposase domain-containing protein n=1 Tax=Streptomyces europaeiscabiei TaxID=146819 RepID=UPI0038F80C71